VSSEAKAVLLESVNGDPALGRYDLSGGPEIRRIRQLSELEREPREAYTGSMGYLRLDGDLDLNIRIQTMTLRGDRLEFRSGAGIVADSQPEFELEESRAKGRGLLRALGAGG
jgi:4-amino-4-deoxychorismate synthase (2-amino-4-deoxychorismate-forming) component I